MLHRTVKQQRHERAVQVADASREAGRDVPALLRLPGTHTPVSALSLASLTGRRFINSLSSAQLALCAPSTADAAAPASGGMEAERQAREHLAAIVNGDAPERLTAAQAVALAEAMQHAAAECLLPLLPAYLAPIVCENSIADDQVR